MKRSYKLREMGDAGAVIAAAPSVSAAAKQLNVERSTVQRWIKSGKVPRPGRPASTPTRRAAKPKNPAAWARAVRANYELSETDLVLVDLGVRALELERDDTQRPDVRLAAASRFQAITKQLNLQRPQAAEDEKPRRYSASSDADTRLARLTFRDPREFLKAVKK